MTELRCGSATDPGLVRPNNQDHLYVGTGLFAVADGMGGHAGGEIASMIAVTTMREAYARLAGTTRVPDDLVAAIQEANAAVYERSLDDISLRGMGTTLTAAALVVSEHEDRLAIANVGDSRGYIFTRNELTQLTEDHSVAEELVRQGQLDPVAVDTHPQRHILTRAMGIMPTVDVDLWEVLPLVGDRVLLCSDGLVRELSDDQIAAVLRGLADPTQAAQALVAKARAAGGADNITVVVVDVVDDDDAVEMATAAVASETPAAFRPTEVEHASPGSSEAPPETPPAPAQVDAGGRVEEPDAPDEAGMPSARGPRRLTLRVVLFVVAIGILLGAAGVAVLTYARGSYYVGLGAPGTAPASALAGPEDRPVLIYQGRPGGLLWFRPTLAERTSYTSAEICPVSLPDLQKGKTTSSLRAAEAYIKALVDEAAQTCGTGSATTTATSTTTAPAPKSVTTSSPTTRR